MKLFLVLLLFSLFGTQALAQRQVYSGTLKMTKVVEKYGEERKNGKYSITGARCNATCGDGTKVEAEIGPVKSSNYNIFQQKLTMACKSALISKCPQNQSKNKPTQPIAKTDNTSIPEKELPPGCKWLDGKKAVATATSNVLTCQSKVCAGEIVCKFKDGSYGSDFVTCLATDEGKCPSAVKCAKENIVEEISKGVKNKSIKKGNWVKEE